MHEQIAEFADSKSSSTTFRFNYGWVIVPIASAMMVATLPGRTHGLGLVSSALMSDLEITPATYAQMNLWATLIGALFCLPCGWMIDRFGLKAMSTFTLAVLSIVVLGMSHVDVITSLFLLITLTRGLGQSMLSIVSITTVGKWFPSRWVGLAMGIYSVLLGVGFGVAFKVVGSSVSDNGWRDTWAGIGWALLILAAVTLFLVRDPSKQSSDAKAADNEATSGIPFRTALMTPCFWVFALASSFYGLFSSGIALFNQAILEKLGFSATLYHNTLATGAIVGMLFNLLGGATSAWISLRWQLSAAMAVMAAALFMLPMAKTETAIYANAIVMGAAGGLVTVVFFAIWTQAFGKMHLGRIQSAAQMLTVVASAVGPLVVAMAQTQTGSYLSAYRWFAPVAALWAVAVAFTPLPDAVSRVTASN